jgi:hypothetical protein
MTRIIRPLRPTDRQPVRPTQRPTYRTNAGSRQLSRRMILGGAGTLLALPFLESLVPRALRQASAGPGDPPLRALFYYVPNGMHMPSWTPATEGPGYALPKILEPLVDPNAMIDLQGDVLVLSGLANLPAKPEGPGDHAGGTSAFLTATHVLKSETDYVNDISIDQLIANAIGEATPHRSLQLGTASGSTMGNCDSGYSCAYTSNISWADPKTPLPKLADPGVIFDLLFSGFDPEATAEELARRRANRLSVIDYANGPGRGPRVEARQDRPRQGRPVPHRPARPREARHRARPRIRCAALPARCSPGRTPTSRPTST